MFTIYHVMDWIRILYWGTMWVLLALVLFLVVKSLPWGWKRAVGVVAALVLVPGMFYLYPRLDTWRKANTPEAQEAKARYETAKAIFDERCKQAGEKIYRTASDVEGITLLNVYPEKPDTDGSYNPEQDPMWLGAALPQQLGEDSYINSFLGWSQKYEHNLEFSPNYSLLTKPRYRPKTNLHPYPTIPYKNYAFVDVVRGNHHFSRYQLYPEAEITSDHYIFHQELKGMQEASRYAVHYEPIVDPKDRQHWIAGAKVSIIDRENQEIMASKTWYAFAPSLAPMRNGPTAWRHAIHCPKDGRHRDPVVKFVISVIQPKQGDENE